MNPNPAFLTGLAERRCRQAWMQGAAGATEISRYAGSAAAVKSLREMPASPSIGEFHFPGAESNYYTSISKPKIEDINTGAKGTIPDACGSNISCEPEPIAPGSKAKSVENNGWSELTPGISVT